MVMFQAVLLCYSMIMMIILYVIRFFIPISSDIRIYNDISNKKPSCDCKTVLSGEPSAIRTPDTLIKSQVLCLLS